LARDAKEVENGFVGIAMHDGQRLFFTESDGPQKPAMILSHGFLMDKSMFAPQIDRFADRYRVIVWDQRGFGRTGYDGEPFTFWDSARDLLAVLDHLGVERAVVGGMSQGGFVALRTALLAPERVAGLVLIDTEAGVFTPEERRGNDELAAAWRVSGPTPELVRTLAANLIGDPTHEERWMRRWLSLGPDVFGAPYDCLAAREDLTPRLGEIGSAALVIHGRQDKAVPIQRGRALAAGLPGGGEFVEIDGGHTSTMTNPDDANVAISDFLRRLAW
jgi:pimeloyl-ACP methyl ester carboxylesterase